MQRFLALLLFALSLPLAAQDYDEYRMEAGVGAGGCFGINDTNSKLFGQAGAAGGALLRFVLNPRMAVKTSLTYGSSKGTTDQVSQFLPAVPGTSGTARLQHAFSGALIDFSVLYELHFLPYGFYSGYQGLHRLVPYTQMGLDVTYSTAGKAATPSIPIGFGIKYKLTERLNLGVEWRMHFTLGDKLDNLENPLGIKSSGFKNKDHFSVGLVTLTYSFAPKCQTCNRDER